MKRVMNLSVVIPAYNDMESLRICLECISAQSLLPLEILVVDGGSTDGSASYALKMGCRILDNERRLSHFGKGLGIVRSRGEYVALIDCDNYLLDPNYFEKALSLFCSYPELVILEPSRLSAKYNSTRINRYLSRIGTDDVLAYLIGYSSRELISRDLISTQHKGFWKGSSTENCLGIYYPLGANGCIIRRSVIPDKLIEQFSASGFHHVRDAISIIKLNSDFEFGFFETEIEHDHCSSLHSYLSKKFRRWGRNSSESVVKFQSLPKIKTLIFAIRRCLFPPRGYFLYHYYLVTVSCIVYLFLVINKKVTGRTYH